MLALLLCSTGTSPAQEFVWSPDLPVGSPLPELRAQDQQGDLRSLEDLKGGNGMLFMLSRSAALLSRSAAQPLNCRCCFLKGHSPGNPRAGTCFRIPRIV